MIYTRIIDDIANVGFTIPVQKIHNTLDILHKLNKKKKPLNRILFIDDNFIMNYGQSKYIIDRYTSISRSRLFFPFIRAA